MHLFYSEKVVTMADDKPKYVTLPTALGGQDNDAMC